MIDTRQVVCDIERCVSHIPDTCKDCSHYYGTIGIGCMEALMEDTLALIKEQEAKIEQLNRFVNGFSLDATPVVRCKNCKHHRKDTCSAAAGIAVPPPDDWFCSDGERKLE